MKLREPRSWPMQKIAADRAERGIRGPAGNRRAIRNEERKNEDDEGGQRGPEGHHVEARKRHILRADLDGEKIVPEAGEGRVGEHEENHERPVHGQQRQIVFGSDHAAGSAGFREQIEPGHLRVRPHKMEPHQPRENHAGEHGHQSEAVILFANNFMVQAEYVLA